MRDVEASAARWTRDFGAGPFFRATFAIDGHTYRGQPHRVNVDVAVGFMGSTIVELTSPVDDAPSPFTDRVGSIRFYPDGSSNGGRVTVGAGGRAFAVDVDWLTGHVTINDAPPGDARG